MLAAVLLAGVLAACEDSGSDPSAGSTSAAPGSSTATPGPDPTDAVPADQSAQPADDGVLTLAFAGDVHFAERTETLLADPATAFGPVAQTLSAADLAMVNLESAITEGGTPEPKEFHFRAPATAFTALRDAGVDVTTMANNHGVDYGADGMADTLAAIGETGFPTVGIGADANQAYAPYVVSADGSTVAFLGVSQVYDQTYQSWTATDTSPGIASTADTDRLLAAVTQARASADVVVVYVHWGLEGQSCPTPEMSSLADSLVAAGADVIVGTHAHLLLGAGYKEQAYVSYGLGNFLWWRNMAFSDDTGVLTLSLQGRQVVDAQFAPAVIDEAGRPIPVSGDDAVPKLDAYAALRECTDLSATPA